MASMNENDGLIAYNGSLATENLNKFREDIEGVLTALNVYYAALMNSVRSYWASSKAVEFYKKYDPKFQEIINGGVSDANSLIERAAGAVSAMARANGGTFSYGAKAAVSISVVSPPLSEVEGWIGINLKSIQEALNEFKASIEKVKTRLSEMNSSIAVYDTNNNVQSLYADKIASLKTKIETATSDVDTDITNAITEQNEIISAAKSRIEAILSQTASSLSSSMA